MCKVFGGERGIRTPDTLAGMHDFESCAFNQALPSLQNGAYDIKFRRSGSIGKCIMNNLPDGAPVIESGDWVAYRKSKDGSTPTGGR